MQTYTIRWTDQEGATTVFNHDKGCQSASNQRLNDVLDALPRTLGIDAFAKQVTRPGASRG